jgi:protein SCO1
MAEIMALPAHGIAKIIGKMRIKFFIEGCIVWIVMAGCTNKNSLPYFNSPDLRPRWSVAGIKSLHTIPSFSFTDQHNALITEKTFEHKIYVANFFFTSCGSVCRTMTTNLLKVQQAFPGNRDVALLSHSVTPWIDSVGKLKAYASRFGMSDKWHMVTGDKASNYKLARQSYFAEEEPGFSKDSSEFLHTERVLLIDRNRHIRGTYNGTLPLEIERLVADISVLLKE